MKCSPKVPVFSGRCHVQLLPATVAHAADTARALALLTPVPAPLRAHSERANWLLWLLWPLLVLAGLTRCAPAHSAATRATYRTEHATPATGRTTWAKTDSLN